MSQLRLIRPPSGGNTTSVADSPAKGRVSADTSYEGTASSVQGPRANQDLAGVTGPSAAFTVSSVFRERGVGPEGGRERADKVLIAYAEYLKVLGVFKP